ncbi:hypothetical protein C8Q79DRAFT_1012041 [Trametes meyenii]|nr:hypothetical protein C8Q79DRAFT_1012041 [Trametes meyenii]
MQLNAKFVALASTLAVMSVSVIGSPATGPSNIVSPEAMSHWISTTDAELTFIGEPINPLSPRAAQNTIVTFCNKRTQNICGGSCSVYNGGPTCLAARGTSCLSATANVGFCDHDNCSGSCNSFDSCGTRLANGFCDTPGTNSIVVGAN